MISPPALTAALKEWAVAVDALAAGEMLVLLRKGGIREPSGKFTIAETPFWLYPTYEHQKPHLLKADYASRVAPVPSGWHPEAVKIPAWAEITDRFEVSDGAIVQALLPFHIWNAEFVTERLKWKPKLPLSVLLLRVYRLPEAIEIPFQPEYGGCKSWISLSDSFPSENARPVLSEADYQQKVEQIKAIVEPAITGEKASGAENVIL
ncbi:DUF1802 family protein [Leptolyngbya ohadii]|uniref:DUF1802 family protein n=1 Tax=Leptolyngbya ohadii TaxID=1962290 RepID=UPI000B59930D|nr:DUF1802 family protein [Leptolyngbya ohadii]